MGPDEEKYCITQFAVANFLNWKFQVKILLIKQGMVQCLKNSVPTSESEKTTFTKQDANTIALLVQCLANSHLLNTPKGKSTKLFLLKKLLVIKFYENNKSMEMFLNRFDELPRDMKATGYKLENDIISVYYYYRYQTIV